MTKPVKIFVAFFYLIGAVGIADFTMQSATGGEVKLVRMVLCQMFPAKNVCEPKP